MRVLQNRLSLEVADAIMFNALNMADAGAIPEEPAGVLFFVLGSLDVAVERRVGRNDADRILSDLEPVLADARHRVRASSIQSGVAPKSEPSFPAVAHGSGPPDSFDELIESGVHPRIDGANDGDDAPGVDGDEVRHGGAPAHATTILVASADSRHRDGLRRRLQQEGHRVVAAHDGHVGLALAVRYQPEVVICDLEMPRVSGKELVSSLKLALGKHRPRVILLTDDVLDPIADVTLQVPKPVHPDVLRHLIAAALAAE